MVVNDHPGCCGAGARLPKSPGIQKLTPPSSATAGLTPNTNAQANRILIDIRSATDIALPPFFIWLFEVAVRTTQTRHVHARIPQRVNGGASDSEIHFGQTGRDMHNRRWYADVAPCVSSAVLLGWRD